MAIADPAASDVAARLADVRRLGILAAPPRGAFDRMAAMAAHAFGVPMAVISAMETEDSSFLSFIGLSNDGAAGAVDLCTSIAVGTGPGVVTDAHQDPRTQGHPLVSGGPRLRFLAAMALRNTDGSPVGTLCVLDVEPHTSLAPHTDFLVDLAGLVTEQLELRRSARLAIAAAEDRLHEVENLVRALQSSLLPPTVPRIPFLDVAAHYQPASRSEVGGDFYDAFPIDDDVWGFVIGDVCGKGPQAAGRTSCARYSIRAAAMQLDHPSDVLKCTNHLLYVEGGSSPDAPFVTAQFARARTRSGGTTIVELASGGHPLPTVLRANGDVQVVGRLGTLLGVLPEVDIADSEFELHAGDTVLFITDGVHDSGRPRPLLQEGLEAVLRGCRGMEPADIVDRVLQEVVAAQRDDVAILAVAARPIVLATRAAVLQPDLASAGEARRLLRGALAEAGRTRWTDAGTLALTEVVTNAVLHAHSPIGVRLEVCADQLRVEVQDANSYLPRQRPHDEHATVGRGMALVSAVTEACGVRSVTGGGKVVWFTLGDAPETSAEDALAEWDVDDWDEPAPLSVPTRPVVLEDIPAMLWLAALQHHDTLLRELVLYVAEHDDVQVDLTRADLARQLISEPVIEAVEEAQRAGTASVILPPNYPAPLPAVPRQLSITLAVPETIGPVYAAFQHALDVAERLAAAGKLLARPGLPEIVAVRNWAHDQVLRQLSGSEGYPWPGTAQRHFETAGRSHVGDGEWHDALVAESQRGVVAADDANRIVAVSRPLAALLGWKVEELVGRRVVTLIPPRLREAHVAGFTRHLTTGEARVLGVPLVLPVLHADGSEISCRFLIEKAPERSARSVYVAWIEAELAAG
jgi:PAS domain S-box-containing protein